MNVQVAIHAEAEQLLSDERFRAEWESLCDRCPWATAFQSPRFARVWWSIYGTQFDLALLTSRRAEGTLEGLLALARSRADGSLIVLGGIHAEYQAWVCDPDVGDVFPPRALAALRQAFPGQRLTFHYLPAQTPIGWLSDGQASRFCHLRTHRRPVWDLGDGKGIAASLKKSSNKNRLRHLKKLGDFEFRKLTDPHEFEELFDEMVELYDLRHGAVHGSLPFCSVDHQKEFHTALFREPGMLHATALRAGGKLVAAHFGVCSKAEVHFGTIVHDPRFARHSPGKVQFLLLAQMLQQEGFARADLTPGDDAYKERHATAWDDVHTLTVWPTAMGRAKAAARVRVAGVIKRVLKRRGLTVVDARNRIRRLGGPARAAALLLRRAAAWVSEQHETRIYVRDFIAEHDAPDNRLVRDAQHVAGEQLVVRVDAWRDLLAYQPTAFGRSRQSFLSKALARLEAGEHAYTVSQGGKLVHLSWMATPPFSDETTAAVHGFPTPEGSVLVQDSGLFTSASSADARAAALQAILRDAREIPGVRRAIVVISARLGDKDLIEKSGLAYAGSIRSTTRFGRRRVCTDCVGEVSHSTPRSDSTSEGDLPVVIDRRMRSPAQYAIPAEEAHLTSENAYPVLS